jgi:SAM-dependent methyltransferase
MSDLRVIPAHDATATGGTTHNNFVQLIDRRSEADSRMHFTMLSVFATVPNTISSDRRDARFTDSLHAAHASSTTNTSNPSSPPPLAVPSPARPNERGSLSGVRLGGFPRAVSKPPGPSAIPMERQVENVAIRNISRSLLLAMGFRAAVAIGLLVLVGGCGASSHPDEPRHAHEPEPLVHRFEHAEEWAKKLDDPSRDAWQKPQTVIDAMEIQPGMTVADIGAGTGYFELRLSRAVGESGTVLALDIEPDMVRYMVERAAREHLSNVRPMLVSMDDPKLPTRGVDRILIVDTWHHIANREAYAAKLRDALRPGGKVFIVDFTRDAQHGPPAQHRLPAEKVVGELSAGGLSAGISSTSLPEQYVVVGSVP